MIVYRVLEITLCLQYMLTTYVIFYVFKKPFIYYAVHTLSKTKLKDVLIEEKPLIYKSFQQKKKKKKKNPH